jgi:hypothetical protein
MASPCASRRWRVSKRRTVGRGLPRTARPLVCGIPQGASPLVRVPRAERLWAGFRKGGKPLRWAAWPPTCRGSKGTALESPLARTSLATYNRSLTLFGLCWGVPARARLLVLLPSSGPKDADFTGRQRTNGTVQSSGRQRTVTDKHAEANSDKRHRTATDKPRGNWLSQPLSEGQQAKVVIHCS